MLSHRSEEPATFALVLPDSLDVYVSFTPAAGEFTIRRRCVGCGHGHAYRLQRSDVPTMLAAAMGYSRAQWGPCGRCGSYPELAQWRPAQDAFAAELFDRMMRLESYTNLHEGELLVKTRVTIPTL